MKFEHIVLQSIAPPALTLEPLEEDHKAHPFLAARRAKAPQRAAFWTAVGSALWAGLKLVATAVALLAVGSVFAATLLLYWGVV